MLTLPRSGMLHAQYAKQTFSEEVHASSSQSLEKRIVVGTGCCQVTVHFSRHWTGKTLPSNLSVITLTLTLSYLGLVNSHYRAVIDTSIVTKHTCDAFLLLYSASMDAIRVRVRECYTPSLNFLVKKA